MKPRTEPNPPLPPEWAFVIQFSDGDVEHGHARVEHVVSGQSTRFDSLATLVAFFASPSGRRFPAGATNPDYET